MSQSVTEHRESAPKSVDCVVVTVSDTRTVETDKSGQIMRERLEAAGHRIVGYHIVRDEPAEIEQLLDRYAVAPDCQAILFNGGTGIASRDTTFDAISRRLEKTLPGFGELFRMLSFSEIGAAAMLSRATAGVLNGTLVISTPGSSNAVALAMDELIAPELAHIIFEINK
ncbi:MAG TPA: molybdenum cofactor biosynthesis protein B [Thermomicrobiales bacterium]|nr:molybdenum cofactor biosynthesis protein B [Thermomicrobiales bacterium]